MFILFTLYCINPLPFSVFIDVSTLYPLSYLCLTFTPLPDAGLKIINRLRQIHKMNQRSKLEEEREQLVPSSPTVHPPSPGPEITVDRSSSLELEPDSSPNQKRRLSSSNRLQRQEQSVREGERGVVDCSFLCADCF